VSVEILSVHLSDESIERLALAVANILAGGDRPTTQSNPGSSQNPQDANGPGSGGQGDPWLNQNGGQQQQGQYQGQQQGQQGPGQQYQGQQNQGFQGQGQQQQGGGHNCAHGPMAFVPAGTNRNTNEPYNQYWKCPLPRGAQGRCRNVYA
jgi:hypothetical protein